MHLQETTIATVEQLHSSGEADSAFDYDTAFQRNLGLVSEQEQGMLRRARVALLGAGGVGGVHALTLARMGVGALRIVDPDHFELANFNRQFGATLSTLNQPKAVAVARQVRDINARAEVEAVEAAFGLDTADRILDGVDLVIDGLDFLAINARRAAYAACRARGIPVLSSGPIGMSASMLLFTAEGMSFERYYDLNDQQDRFEQLAAFLVGTTPAMSQQSYLDISKASVRTGAAPSLGAACCLCAGVVGIEALRVLLGRPGLKPAPHYYQFDAYRRRFFSGRLMLGNRGPLQRIKRRRVAAMLRERWEAEAAAPIESDVRALTGQASSHGRPGWRPCEGSDAPTPVRVLAEAAGCAPSADNMQPWSLLWEHDRLRIVHRPGHEGQSLFGPGDHGTLLSIGAAVENVRQAAEALGLEQHWRLAPEAQLAFGSEAKPYAELVVVGEADSAPVPAPIRNRQTNRAPFSQEPLDPALIAELASLVHGGCRLRVISERNSVTRLAGIVGRASVLRLTDRELHRGLASCLRFDAADVARGDGLDVGTLHLPPGARAILRRLCDWRWMRVARLFGLHRVLAKQEALAVCASGALVAVVGPPTRSAALEAGQLMQRAWLKLHQAGVAVQPVYAPTDVLMRENDSVNARRTRTVVSRDLAKLDLQDSDHTLHMLLRVGFGTREMPPSRRLPLSEVLWVRERFQDVLVRQGGEIREQC